MASDRRPLLTRRTTLGAALALSTGALGACGSGSDVTGAAAAPTTDPSRNEPAPSAPESVPEPAIPTVGAATGTAEVVDTLTEGMVVPWGLALLPDGSLLVTSRDDFHVYRIDPATGERSDAGQVPGVVSNVGEAGEAGLLGIAVSPTYADDSRLYVYYSTASENRVAHVLHRPDEAEGRRLGALTTVVGGIPHNVHHNGGRLAFGPDGSLYASTGEAEQPELAQDLDSLGGKILRMTPDGAPVDGSPFGSLVHSYGHRNVQGLAFDAQGRLFASEFGDKTADELNLIEAGANYGWPETEGRTSDVAYTAPIAQWGTEEDSPSGIAIAAGCVWMAALQGECLWRIPLDGTEVTADPVAFLQGDHGRLRSVLALDEATLLVTTSNTDGRSEPGDGDDRVLRVAVT